MVIPKTLPRDHDGRVSPDVIDALFSHSQQLDGRVTGIEKVIGHISEKLDQVATAVTQQAAIPRSNLSDTLGIVSKASTLLMFAAGAIIFIATSISAGPVATLQARDLEYGQRMMRMESALRRVEEHHMNYVLANARGKQ